MMTAVIMMRLMKIMMMVGRSNTTNVITIDALSFLPKLFIAKLFIVMLNLIERKFNKT